MEIWIRSQDKKILSKINSAYIDEFDGQWIIYGYYTNAVDYYRLGAYEPKSRALEVLDQVQDLLIVNNKFEGIYERVDLNLKSGILSNMAKIYDMPLK